MKTRVSTLLACALAALTSLSAGAGTPAPPHGDYDQAPKLIKHQNPAYPQAAFEKQIEGTVLIEYAVNEKGEPQDPVVLTSVPGLDEAALACLKQWRFVPAMREGRPVKATARAPFTFRIYRKQD